MLNKYKEMMIERLVYVINNKSIIGYYLNEESTLKALEYLLLDEEQLSLNKGYLYIKQLDKNNLKDVNVIKILKLLYQYVNSEVVWNDDKPKKLSVLNEYIKLANLVYKETDYIIDYKYVKRDKLSDVNGNIFISIVNEEEGLYARKNLFLTNDIKLIREKIK